MKFLICNHQDIKNIKNIKYKKLKFIKFSKKIKIEDRAIIINNNMFIF